MPSRRASRIVRTSALAALAALGLGSCGVPRAPADRPRPIGAIEALYAQVRALRDQIDVTRSRGANATLAGVPLAELARRYDAARTGLAHALAAGATPVLSEQDDRALTTMRRTLAEALPPEDLALESATTADASEVGPDCAYDPALVADGSEGAAALSKRIYICFTRAAYALSFDGQPIDRLTIFGRLPLVDDPARREQLWRALAPVWVAINGDNGPQSPFRTLVDRHARRAKEAGQQLGEAVRSIGVEPAQMEEWLVSVLEQWREIRPDTPLEPWDFAYQAGLASRELGPGIELESLRAINDRFYTELGADPVALDVHYDLDARASKDPVAFTTFGRRPQLDGERVIPGEPWVFASYSIGGLDNLLELLHETGHAVHIAAIRTRPAFADWPDSDIFTEALAELAALEIYSPEWQRRYLGRAVPTETGIAAKYAGIVMDIAWALFELRLHRDPQRDPNELWTEITGTYLRIEAHPELAWWAVRGQLVDAPGYMMNYAAGAILAADLRARLRELHGSVAEGDPGWYGRVAQGLYRYGLEKPSKQVIEEFLGRPLSPQALLDDMARAPAREGGRLPARRERGEASGGMLGSGA
jgi:hypothetical protein